MQEQDETEAILQEGVEEGPHNPLRSWSQHKTEAKEEPKPEPKALERHKLEPLVIGDDGMYIIRNQSDEHRVASMLLSTGAVNQSLKNPVQVMVAMQAARSFDLNPVTSLRQIGFINGSLTFYGDLELAIVRKSPLYGGKVELLYCKDKDGKYVKRHVDNHNIEEPVVAATCKMWRKGEEDFPEEVSFSVEDAKLAGLWERTPTWKKYPARMLQMRARGLCIRNMFSDLTQGMATQEYDMEGVDYGRGRPVHSQHDPIVEAKL